MNAEYRRQRAVYVISVAAELAGMHPQTLRIYERKGLLAPARTGGGSRRYSDADIRVLQRIQELTNDRGRHHKTRDHHQPNHRRRRRPPTRIDPRGQHREQ